MHVHFYFQKITIRAYLYLYNLFLQQKLIFGRCYVKWHIDFNPYPRLYTLTIYKESSGSGIVVEYIKSTEQTLYRAMPAADMIAICGKYYITQRRVSADSYNILQSKHRSAIRSSCRRNGILFLHILHSALFLKPHSVIRYRIHLF